MTHDQVEHRVIERRVASLVRIAGIVLVSAVRAPSSRRRNRCPRRRWPTRVERQHRRADIGAREREVLDESDVFPAACETNCNEPRRRCSARARCRAAATCDSDSCRSPSCSIAGRRCKPARRNRRCPKTACRPSARATSPLHLRSQQNLRRAERSGGENHVARVEREVVGEIQSLVPHAVNAPSAAARVSPPI